MSLDGYVAGPKGELDWFVKEGRLDSEFGDYARTLIKNVGAILMGRNTYEGFVSYWPTASAEAGDDPVIAERMNNLPKVVFSSTLKKVQWGKWGRIRLVKKNAAQVVARMKKEEGKDIIIYGSATLVSRLLKEGLIDELQILLQPIILGRGRPEFKDLNNRYSLRLEKSKVFMTGAVVLYYQPAVPER
jgi:dihydrofolate reductase